MEDYDKTAMMPKLICLCWAHMPEHTFPDISAPMMSNGFVVLAELVQNVWRISISSIALPLNVWTPYLQAILVLKLNVSFTIY